MNFVDILSGAKSYIAAAGMAGLALYQLTQGQFDLGLQSLLAALAVLGVRHAIAKQDAVVEEVKMQMKNKE